jgi:hypothetical protein
LCTKRQARNGALHIENEYALSAPSHIHELTSFCFHRWPLLTNDVWRGMLAAIHYLHHNPVCGRFVNRAVDWKWSSGERGRIGQLVAGELVSLPASPAAPLFGVLLQAPKRT